MTLPRIVGITGYARHGKDTIANVLSRELGYSRVALADQMKALMLRLDPMVGPTTPLDNEHPATLDSWSNLSEVVAEHTWEGAKRLPEVRRLLQVFGTEVGREGLGEDVWIGALAKATPGLYADRKIVIPDIRFTNEADFIRRMHGQVWGVERPNFDNGLGPANGTHASERDIPLLLQGADLKFTNEAPSAAAFSEQVYRVIKNELCKVAV